MLATVHQYSFGFLRALLLSSAPTRRSPYPGYLGSRCVLLGVYSVTLMLGDVLLECDSGALQPPTCCFGCLANAVVLVIRHPGGPGVLHPPLPHTGALQSRTPQPSAALSRRWSG